MSPPISVTVISGSRSFITTPAESVLYGRLRGAIAFGLDGSSVNSPPRLCNTKPYPGTVTPDPNSEKLLFTHETMLPSLSAVESTMVSPAPSAVPRGPVDEARFEFTRRQSDAAYDVDNSFVSGTSFEFGSALYR